jgi:excinuclease ABC subunit B
VERFQLVSDYAPRGDQPKAIDSLVEAVESGKKHNVLLGVTGSGKTFTVANVVERLNMPTLVISPNKTLAAQLYSEFKSLFPYNAVEYFVSYYDYYQPEAYLPATDTFIEKDSSINEQIDKLRLAATASLISRRDVLIVASVSCIYGIGTPEDYEAMSIKLFRGDQLERSELLEQLVDIQYVRNDLDLSRGHFRVIGDTVDLYPAYGDKAYRIEFFGDEIDRLSVIDPLTTKLLNEMDRLTVFPARHFVSQEFRIEKAVKSIEAELEERLEELNAQGKLVEAQRLESRTRYDLDMLREVGYCNGIENYSRHLSAREPGSRPNVLLDFFPADFLLVLDESHVGIPQLNGMYNGDRSRKSTLVDHGFRLPSALDNRPLKFEEFEQLVPRTIYTSATPGPYEVEQAADNGTIIEQIIRPTGLVDPVIEVRHADGQVDDLVTAVRERLEMGQRTLVTCLTKRMAEDLSDYLNEAGIEARYLHSEIDTIERVEIIRGLRLGEFDVLVGINLLREGLDLPEVSLVAILDADKEGFLRNARSLIQTIGRCARNVQGKVIMYARDARPSNAMREAIGETERRRRIQTAYNKEHGIVPQTIVKTLEAVRMGTGVADASRKKDTERQVDKLEQAAGELETLEQIRQLEQEMLAAAEGLEFEKAAMLRDRIKALAKEIDLKVED